MKIKIKVLVLTPGCLPSCNKKGDWIDLYVAQTGKYEGTQYLSPRKEKDETGKISSRRDIKINSSLIPLGVAMQLPEGYEAIIAPRSSTFLKKGILMSNSIGIIDNSFCGANDEWKFPAIFTDTVTVEKGERICQFRIQLSQKATIWQKIKNLFYSEIEFIPVHSLSNQDRNGFGSTGK